MFTSILLTVEILLPLINENISPSLAIFFGIFLHNSPKIYFAFINSHCLLATVRFSCKFVHEWAGHTSMVFLVVTHCWSCWYFSIDWRITFIVIPNSNFYKFFLKKKHTSELTPPQSSSFNISQYVLS